ncbi:MAG: hypothetical protein JJ863_21530 [Deltaproteobacteria bacterium]|nr:hypothetical protein [Deltaproteobacteria bacterium]
MQHASTRLADLADLVHRAATSDIRHDLDSLVDALTHVTLPELAEAFAAAYRANEEDARDLGLLCDFIAPIAQETCRGQVPVVLQSSPALDPAVRAITAILGPVYVEDDAPEERARNIVCGLAGDPDPAMWEGIAYSLRVRELAVELPEAALESLALRVLAAFVAATRPESDQLTKVGDLTRYGVPARWAVCSASLVSPVLEGAA